MNSKNNTRHFLWSCRRHPTTIHNRPSPDDSNRKTIVVAVVFVAEDSESTPPNLQQIDDWLQRLSKLRLVVFGNATSRRQIPLLAMESELSTMTTFESCFDSILSWLL